MFGLWTFLLSDFLLYLVTSSSFFPFFLFLEVHGFLCALLKPKLGHGLQQNGNLSSSSLLSFLLMKGTSEICI